MHCAPVSTASDFDWNTPIMPTRRTTLRSSYCSPLAALGLALLLAGAPSTQAQVGFVNKTAEYGITFVSQYGPTLPYDADITELDGIGLDIIQRNAGNGVALADYDNDGDIDLLCLGQKGYRSALYRNDLPAGFTDVTAAAGIFNTGQSRVAMFTDLDNDGWMDLVIANDTKLATTCSGSDSLWVGKLSGGRGSSPFAGQQEAPSSIYRNNGNGTFSDVTAGSGFVFRGFIVGGMGLVDFDEDGRVDIYITTWGARQNNAYTLLEGHNRLYRNLGGFRFQDVTRMLGLGKLESNCYSPIFADFDLDGDSDLFIPLDAYADKFYRYGFGLGEFAHLFTDQSTQVGATHVGTDMGVAPADFDDDGDLDLFVTNVTDPGGAYGGNTLLVNQFVPTGQLSFVNEAVARGVKDTGWGWGAEWIDVDNDGDRDLYAVNGFDDFVMWQGLHFGMVNRKADLFINNGSGFFTKSVGTGAEIVGDARSVVAFDVDRDGDQDLFITHVDVPPALLINTLNDNGAVNHWLDVKLVGGGLVSRDALGARIKVTVGSKNYTHEVIGGGSYLAGRTLEAHFGLGAATLINQLRVTWPDGVLTTLNNVPVDQYLVVAHP
jgi:hypothetical protein